MDAGAALDYPMNPLFTPYDIVAAHLERRQYFDKNSGEWCHSHKESHCHYHARLSCIVKVEPLFIPSSLQIPEDQQQQLQTVHWQLLSISLALL